MHNSWSCASVSGLMGCGWVDTASREAEWERKKKKVKRQQSANVFSVQKSLTTEQEGKKKLKTISRRVIVTKEKINWGREKNPNEMCRILRFGCCCKFWKAQTKKKIEKKVTSKQTHTNTTTMQQQLGMIMFLAKVQICRTKQQQRLQQTTRTSSLTFTLVG